MAILLSGLINLMNIFKGIIMRYLVIAFLCLSACSHPTVDLRASGENAQYYERDLFECKRIVNNIPMSFLYNHKLLVEDCLEGRGHSIIGAGI